MATIERDVAPWLTIDCGAEGLTAYLAHYGQAPRALFITHVHMDHVAGFERLFVADYFDAARRGKTRLYVPATVRSEEHTSELQSLMRISYAVFCLKKKNTITITTT